MKFNLWKIFGVLFFIKGAVLLFLFYYGMTGFAIVEDLSSRTGSVLGLALVIGGIGLFLFEREDRFRGRDSLRRHNKEAEYAMKQTFIEEHGRHPSRKELRELTRKYHVSGELHEIVDSYRKSA